MTIQSWLYGYDAWNVSLDQPAPTPGVVAEIGRGMNNLVDVVQGEPHRARWLLRSPTRCTRAARAAHPRARASC